MKWDQEKIGNLDIIYMVNLYAVVANGKDMILGMEMMESSAKIMFGQTAQMMIQIFIVVNVFIDAQVAISMFCILRNFITHNQA